MTEKDLDKLIDKAPVEKVRECLKEIATLWFVEDGIATPDKKVDSDVIMYVTESLDRHHFCPKEGE
jgi:hypothetical protein